MQIGSGHELELKLEVTAQDLHRIGGHPALGPLTVGDPETHTLRTVYFDTPDHRLRAQGISLRLRCSDGGPWVQTVKIGNGLRDGLAYRREFETSTAAPEPDVNAISDRKVRRNIARAQAASSLEPLFETVVKRTTHKLHSEESDLELALEEGVVRAGKDEETLCEAELELKSGSPASLLDIATTVFAQGPLHLSHRTKAERGYDLLLGRRSDGIVPERATPPQLRGDESSGEALSLFVGSAATQIICNRRVVLETDDPEGAHQLRIGLRRLRSALRAFRPLADSEALREMETQARDLARAIGRLRDVDVLIEDIYAPVAGKMKGEAGFVELREALAAHRGRIREEARQALSGKQWSTLQLYLLLWPRTIAEEGALQTPIRKYAVSALNKGWKKLARLGQRIDSLSLEQRHEMRKALKRFRYTLEFFGSLLPAHKGTQFAKQLKKLQDVFGYVNDVATAKELSAIAQARTGQPQAQGAAGYVLGWHNAQAVHAWTKAPKEWRRLEKRAGFWH